jgi:2-desacetyl-2-hydroxyethyl bacteriochlorophyllide A dehydrogenase
VRAVTFVEPGRVAVADVPEPRIEEPGDALVRVTLAGLCGSDLHFLHARAPLEPGDVMGHEAVGIVEAVGGTVTSVAGGERVVASFDIACGSCWFCAHGETGLCDRFRSLGAGVFGGELAGAQAELVRIPLADVNLHALPDVVDDERAVFVADVLTTAVHAIELADLDGGETVAIVGAGPVGILVAHVAMGRSPAEVIVVDVEPARLGSAERYGAVALDASSANPQTWIHDRTDGRGADVVIDAVGSPEAFERSLDLVRRGGTVVVVGLYAGETVAAQLGVWWARAIDLRFTGICPVHAVWDRTIDGLVDGRLDPAPLISHRLPLEEAVTAYELFDRREATKVVLVP